MSEHERMTPELQAFEALLAGLEPAAPALDRDRLMYEAGRASMDAAGRRGWPVATLCVGLVALAVGRWTALPSRPAPLVAERRPPAVGAISTPNELVAPADSWIQLRASLIHGEATAMKPSDHAGLPQGPRAPAETWLEERRLLLESLN